MRMNRIYFKQLCLLDDTVVDVHIETMERSDFTIATIILGIISVIGIGSSAGIVIWFKRTTKAIGNHADLS
jgi:hypothetical protein